MYAKILSFTIFYALRSFVLIELQLFRCSLTYCVFAYTLYFYAYYSVCPVAMNNNFHLDVHFQWLRGQRMTSN